MKSYLLMLPLLGLLIVAESQAQDDIAKERKALQGTWIAASGERSGKQVAEEEVKKADIRLIIKGDKCTLKTTRNEQGMEGTIKIDPSKKPATIDISFEEGKKPLVGIYEVKGDTLKICYGPERPTEFKTKPDTDQRLHVYKRQKP